MPDLESVTISIVALAVAIAGTLYQILDRRRVYLANLPRVDVEYTLWATEDDGHIRSTFSKPRFILRNTGKGTARYMRFSGAVARVHNHPLKSAMNPYHEVYRTNSWRSVTYTHEVHALDPGEIISVDVGDLADETDNVTVVSFEDPLDKSHYTVARFTFDGENRDWMAMAPSRTFSARWRLARYLQRLMDKAAARDLTARL